MLKLAIGNTIRFPVRIRLNDARQDPRFSFLLTGQAQTGRGCVLCRPILMC